MIIAQNCVVVDLSPVNNTIKRNLTANGVVFYKQLMWCGIEFRQKFLWKIIIPMKIEYFCCLLSIGAVSDIASYVGRRKCLIICSSPTLWHALFAMC